MQTIKNPSVSKNIKDKLKLEGGKKFIMETPFNPAGDQPKAISELYEGLTAGEQTQVLLGATGTGKTFTMAKVIEATQRPAIILAPNKTLAAQLYGEFKSYFPNNSVEYFVSFYDYYSTRSLRSSHRYLHRKKKAQLMNRLIVCVTQQPVLY